MTEAGSTNPGSHPGTCQMTEFTKPSPSRTVDALQTILYLPGYKFDLATSPTVLTPLTRKKSHWLFPSNTTIRTSPDIFFHGTEPVRLLCRPPTIDPKPVLTSAAMKISRSNTRTDTAVHFTPSCGDLLARQNSPSRSMSKNATAANELSNPNEGT